MRCYFAKKPNNKPKWYCGIRIDQHLGIIGHAQSLSQNDPHYFD